MNIGVLVLCGDKWHAAATARRGLDWPGDHGFEFEFVEDRAKWKVDMIPGFQVVVLAKSNSVSASGDQEWLTQESERDFCAHIRRGIGLVVVHSGTVSGAEIPMMRGMIGGTFLRHPPQCPVTFEPRQPHPLTHGVTAFTATDEHYFIEMEDTQADIFLHSSSGHGVQPAGWIRAEGEGRVCVLTPGHNPEVWLHRSFQRLLVNALRWAAK
jgi:uncharacterized protein